MTKRELINSVKEKLEQKGKNYKKWEVEEVLNPLFDSILETLQRGEEVNVKNFGKFDLKYSKPRKKRGSNNTESANLPTKARVVFNAKRTFKIDAMMIDKTKP